MVDTNKQPGYGAIDVLPGGNEEFDERNTYYLNEGGFTLNRFFRAAVPIVIALVIMSGFGYGMSHGFSHFYGPPKVDDNSDKQDESWIPLDNSKYDAGEAPESHMSDAGCEMNKKCAKLELVGYCCPTNHGVMLECCH